MKKINLLWFLPIIGIIVFATACTGPAEPEEVEVDLSPEIIQEGEVLDFETITKSVQSGYQEEGIYVITNETVFADLWEIASSEELPEIDFANQMVLAVFMGEQVSGGHSIEIVEIIETDKAIEVKIEETYPSEDDMVSMALTYPEHMVTTKSTLKELIFNKIK